ncbi:DUF3172 domain-containing protein [Neosynechococcus sphagnicola]|uniref:DUF3172 domain-containing protein n=1 Tax=Neosynechococcus sphagnicola TaxID=1501145 RepID=UPI000A9B1035|nr:DUF3172 domain-containing protein [Neosynechococcus sphagnicola]
MPLFGFIAVLVSSESPWPADLDPLPLPPRAYRAAPAAATFNYTSLAILGGIFILGVGVGIGFSSVATSGPENVATRDFIDRSAPNPEVCVEFGASAMVMDTRVFVTLNPFNVYVSQPKMQPGCVLRSTNWGILEQRKLLTSDQVRDCRNRMNTFGFTGTLESSPQISCIYQNEAAQNLFLTQPGVGSGRPETNKF